jgi:hypothetical protein
MRSVHSSNPARWAALVLLLPACAVIPRSPGTAPAQILVSAQSSNRSDVDVYLLCGSRDARWLGVVEGKGSAAFEFPASATRCVSGLNFFLVHRESGWRYRVGPLRPRAGGEIDLAIAKYAGLSEARVRGQSAMSWSAGYR